MITKSERDQTDDDVIRHVFTKNDYRMTFTNQATVMTMTMS